MAPIFYRGRKYRIPSDTKTRLLKNAQIYMKVIILLVLFHEHRGVIQGKPKDPIHSEKKLEVHMYQQTVGKTKGRYKCRKNWTDIQS